MWIAASLVSLGACRSSSPPPQGGPQRGAPAPPPPAGGQGACGVQLFHTPACQATLDASCCPLEIECARDPLCVQLDQCIDRCRATTRGQAGDQCMNDCARASRFAYCEAACRGQGPDCPTVCAQQGGLAEPMRKWGLIADCSKGLRYPDGVVCDDNS